MKRSFFAWPYVVWMIVFTVLPLLFVAYYGFTDATGALSLDNWREFFTSGDLRTLWLSVRLALECTAVCLVVGYPAAVFSGQQGFFAAQDAVCADSSAHVDELPSAHLRHAHHAAG